MRSIIIPEGRAKNGWRVFGLELRKMLELENHVNGGSSHSKFFAQPRKDNSRIQPCKTFADAIRGQQVQVRGSNQPHMLSIHNKGKLQLGDNKGMKQNPVIEQMMLSEIPASIPSPTALGGGKVSSRCINADLNLGEPNPVGNKKRLPLKFNSNLNESLYGKGCELRRSYWIGEGLTVEVNGEGKMRVAWNNNKGGWRSFKWVTRCHKEHVLGLENSGDSLTQQKPVVGPD